MVAKLNFVNSNGSGAMADYYLRPTQPEWERNQDLEYQLQNIPNHKFTVPIFQQNMPSQIVHAFRLDMDAMQRDPHPQLENLFAGLRADGEHTGKRAMSVYTRQDGKEFAPKTYFDITISNHISVGLAMVNSETPAGRAMLYSAAMDANSHAVAGLVERIGWTRQGAGGSGGEVKAFPLVVTFPHHATSPTQSGFVAPNLHFHNIVFSSVVTEDGRVRALHTVKFRNESIIKTKMAYHDRLENNLKSISVDVQRQKIGSVMLSAVPEHVNKFFIQRTDEIFDRARENSIKKGLDFDALPEKLKHKYIQTATYQTRGNSHDGITQPQAWRLACARLDWTARDLPQLAVRAFNMNMEAGLAYVYRQTWQQTRQAIEQRKIRNEPAAFNVKLKRQIVAATLAMQLSQFQAPKRSLEQEFLNLAKSFSENKIKITQKLTGRKLVHSLTPALVELKRMSDNPNLAKQTQPLQKDHESLGAYLAQRHKLASDMGPRIAAAGELVDRGAMRLSDAVEAMVRDKANDSMRDRLTGAITQAAEFYDSSTNGRSFTVVGSYKTDGPVGFANSYGDAALMRDATGGKFPVVVGYTEAGTAQAMRDFRESEPKREFLRLADAGADVPRETLTATITPPKNAADASTWQEYAKAYGVDAVGSNMRQAYRQEFRQNQGMKLSQAAE